MYRAERLGERSLGILCSYLPFTANHILTTTVTANRGIIVHGCCTYCIYYIIRGFMYSSVPYWTIQKPRATLILERLASLLHTNQRTGLAFFPNACTRQQQSPKAMTSGPSNESSKPRLMRWSKAFGVGC
jgi:hypothetical protein